MVDAVIFDLDGVIREWNNHLAFDAESAAGIEPGTLLALAFSPELGEAAVTGSLSWERWMDQVSARYVAVHGDEGHAIVTAWSADYGTLVPEMVLLLADVRASVPVAILSNGTTRLESELDHHGLTELVDHVCNTARIGAAKPDAAAYLHALEVLGVTADRAAFIDDLTINVEAAAALGLASHRHEHHDSTRTFLAGLGIVAHTNPL